MRYLYTLLLCLVVSFAAQAQRQLVISNSHAFDYSDSKRVERRSRKVRKQNQKACKRILHQREKQMNRELRLEAAEHRRRLKFLREITAKK